MSKRILFQLAEFRCPECGHNPILTTIAYRQFDGSICNQCGKAKMRAVRLFGLSLRGKEKVA